MSKIGTQHDDAALAGAFGFDPNESAAHFLVHIPTSAQQAVEISEHLSWDANKVSVSAHYGPERADGQVRCRLARTKWNDIADTVRAELNARLKAQGKRLGKWKLGYNPVERTLGKELTLLMWAIEDADPSLVRTAIINWQGLAPEERWWLYTMTAAATGHCQTGRGVGWRKAIRYALTENPITHRLTEQPIVPEFFRLIEKGESIFEHPQPRPAEPTNGQHVEPPAPLPVPATLYVNDEAPEVSPAKRPRARKRGAK